MRANRPSTRAFSLIELTVGVTIIGILLAVALPTFLRQRQTTQDRTAQADLTSAGKQAKAFYVENGFSFEGLEDNLPADWVSHRGEPVAVKQLHTHVVCLTTTSGSGTEWALRIVSAPVDGYDQVGEELDRADELGECGAGEDASEAGAIILAAAVYDPNTGNLELEWDPDPEADGYEICVEDDDCEIVYGTSWSGHTGGKGVTVRSIRNGNTGPGTPYHPSTGSGGSGGSSGGGSSGGGSTPPPPVDDEDSGGEFTVEQVGNIVRLTFTDTGTGADIYEIRRCIDSGCTDGEAIDSIPSNGPDEYTYNDNVTELIENGVTLARYQVVAFKGVSGTASNWAEVHLVPQAPEGTWAAITTGYSHTCGLTTAGDAYCWGDNYFGQLGNGSTEDAYTTPTPVVSVDHPWAAIAAGGLHTCGLTTTGDAYCWGYNGDGQLGDGSTTDDASTPTPVSVDHPWAAITTGDYHTCGLTTTGDAYCWGYNGSGQLGTGSTGGWDTTPQAVVGGPTFETITAGADHTCGITTTKTAYCWGSNWDGQLGNGSTDDADTPQAVVGGLTFEMIAAGNYHTCGITTTKTAYCWGDNWYGQRGNDSTTDASSTPTPVVSVDHPWAAIAAGGLHTCGLTTAKTAYCWGSNWAGQLGNDSTTDDASTPQDVAGGLSWAAIATGNSHTCGLTTTGDAYCWGYNGDGQLGDGSTTDAYTPAQVSEPTSAG